MLKEMSAHGSEKKRLGVVFHLSPVNPGAVVFDKETRRFGLVATTGEEGKLFQTGGRPLRTENFVTLPKLPMLFVRTILGIANDVPANENTVPVPTRRRTRR